MASLSNLVLQREDKLGDMAGMGSIHFQKKWKEKSLYSAQLFSEPSSSLGKGRGNVFGHGGEKI